MTTAVSGSAAMRIVQVAPTYYPCVVGAERLVREVSERLATRGHTVTIVTFDCATMRDFSSPAGAGLPPQETLNGVDIVRVSPVAGPLIQLHQWWLRQPGGWRSTAWMMHGEVWPFQLPSGLGLLFPVAELPADVVTSVNWYFGASYWTCLPRHVRRAPRVAIPILHIEQEWAQKRIYERMLRKCDATIVCTDAEREFVEARGATFVSVAGAGVDPSRFDGRDGEEIRRRFGLGQRPVVGFVGRQDVAKGVPTLLDAMQNVWRIVPDAVLVLAGQRAHREPGVAKAIESLQAAQRGTVVLIDDFDDCDGPSILDACDVVALPSVEESFGLVMIEAWVCGKPVIGADIASTRCIVDPGIDGLLVTPFDAEDLAAKILVLLADPPMRESFGKRGRQKVLARYTWDRVTDAWEQTFANVVAASRA